MSEVSAIIGAISVIIVDYLVAQLDAGASLVQVGCFASETFSDPKAGELLLQLRKKQRSPSPSLTKKKNSICSNQVTTRLQKQYPPSRWWCIHGSAVIAPRNL